MDFGDSAWSVNPTEFDLSIDLFFAVLAPFFSSPDRWIKRTGRKKTWPFFEGYQSWCWAGYYPCDMWHGAARWLLGAVQTSACVPCKLLGPHQAATASGASQGEIPHSWEPQTNAGLPLNSSGQHSCAVGESTSRKMSHMVGFPRTSTAPLAKVLESALVEPRNIPRW